MPIAAVDLRMLCSSIRAARGPRRAAQRRGALDRAAEQVRLGQRLSSALEREQLTTPVSLRMLAVGERSGELGGMLAQAASFYDEELERLSDLVTRIDVLLEQVQHYRAAAVGAALDAGAPALQSTPALHAQVHTPLLLLLLPPRISQ